MDNAIRQNFFGTVKAETFYVKKYSCSKELQKDIIEFQ
ncbi:hypothetical protein ADIARSV_1930 [Arcticibacter svalbardensis MN12-7]|uniref:Uncharacterized protein n=1 Tax=Arcticibacter svalbardensis MN12-7 TaxID=1150600 RepID=R9GT54_9SPHI|nr:hypothetical protein ADIARSV_1930 [Arcticibacter svalbardensis MN12-7]